MHEMVFCDALIDGNLDQAVLQPFVILISPAGWIILGCQ